MGFSYLERIGRKLGTPRPQPIDRAKQLLLNMDAEDAQQSQAPKAPEISRARQLIDEIDLEDQGALPPKALASAVGEIDKQRASSRLQPGSNIDEATRPFKEGSRPVGPLDQPRDRARGFVQNLFNSMDRSGVAGTEKQSGRFLEMLSSLTDMGGLESPIIPRHLMSKGGAALRREGERVESTLPAPGVSSYKDIHGVGDVPEYLGTQIGQAVGSSVPSVLAAAGTGGSSALVTFLAAAAPSYVQNVGETMLEMDTTAPGVDEKKKAVVASVIGVPMAALDVIFETRIGKQLFEAIAKEGVHGVAGQTVKEWGLNLVKVVGKEAGMGMLTEGPTEGAQEALQYYGSRVPFGAETNSQEAISRVLDAVLGGALGGASMGGGTTAATHLSQFGGAKKERDERDTAEAQTVAQKLMAQVQEVTDRLTAPTQPKAPETAKPVEPSAPNAPEPAVSERETVAPRSIDQVADELSKTATAVRDLTKSQPATPEEQDAHDDQRAQLEQTAERLRKEAEQLKPKVEPEQGIGAAAPKGVEGVGPSPSQETPAPVSEPERLPGVTAAPPDVTAPDPTPTLEQAREKLKNSPLPPYDPTGKRSPAFVRQENAFHDARDEHDQALDREADRLGIGKRRESFHTDEAAPDLQGTMTRQVERMAPRRLVTQEISEKGTITRERLGELISQYFGIQGGGSLGPGEYGDYKGGKNPSLTVDRHGEKLTLKGKKLLDTMWQALNLDKVLAKAPTETVSSPALDTKNAVSEPAPSTPERTAPPPGQTAPERGELPAGHTWPTAPLRFVEGSSYDVEDSDPGSIYQGAVPDIVDAATEAATRGELWQRGYDLGGKKFSQGTRDGLHNRALKQLHSAESFLESLEEALGPEARQHLQKEVQPFIDRARKALGLETTNERTNPDQLRGLVPTPTEAERPGGVQAPSAERGAEGGVPSDRGADVSGVPTEPGPLPEGSEPTAGEPARPSADDRGSPSTIAQPDLRDVPAQEPGGGKERGGGDVSGVVEPAGRNVGGRGAGDVEATTKKLEEADPGRKEGKNFPLTPEDLDFSGSALTRASRNIAALATLRTIQKEKRSHATFEEQQALAKYVGWGMFPRLFKPAQYRMSPDDNRWLALQQELRNLVSDEEYKAAEKSTQYAHYTSPVVINFMHNALHRMGVTRGMAMEPSAGVGHFIGLTPKSMPLSWRAVELEPIAGAIAQLLYPQASVQVKGFQDVIQPNGRFAVVVGNPPFGANGPFDRLYKGVAPYALHEYFFLRAADLVHPGGIVAMVTSTGTLNKADPRIRDVLGAKLNLVAAFRLPGDAFKENAGTEVTTDVLFFQRRGDGDPSNLAEWRDVVEVTDAAGKKWQTNQYFAAHPDLVGGQYVVNKLYGSGMAVALRPGESIEKHLARFASIIPEHTFRDGRTDAAISKETIEAPAASLPSSIIEKDGKLYRVTPEKTLELADIGKSEVPKVRALVGLRDAARKVLSLQKGSDAELEKARKDLADRYKKFTAAYGPVNKRTVRTVERAGKDPYDIITLNNLKDFRADPYYPLVASLENYDEETEQATPTEMVTRGRVLLDREVPTKVDLATDALSWSMTVNGKVDVPYMAKLRGVSEQELLDELKGVIYKDPLTEEYELASVYLSGDVHGKLGIAQGSGDQYRENVDALIKTLPAARPIDDFAPGVKLGQGWVVPEEYAEFTANLLGGRASEVDIERDPKSGKYTVSSRLERLATNRVTYGTREYSALDLISAGLNLERPRVTWKDEDGKTHVNEEESALAVNKLDEINEKFRQWLADPKRKQAIEDRWNRAFNSNVAAKVDGRLFKLPGSAEFFRGKKDFWRDHQLNVIARYLTTGNLLAAHAPGAGKTITFVAMAMEAKRLNRARRAMIAVPNSVLAQAAAEAREIYPNARILALDTEDTSALAKKMLAARIAAQDWDIIITSHNALDRLPMSKAYERRWLDDEIANFREEIESARDRSGIETQEIKRMQKALEKLEEKLKELMDQPDDTRTINFEQLGVDLLITDESQEYKNLRVVSTIQGLSKPGNKKTTSMLQKTDYMHQVNPGRGVAFFTGTPITNSMVEMWVVARYLRPDLLNSSGYRHTDDWAAMFVETADMSVKDPGGTRVIRKEVPVGYKNWKALVRFYREFADIQTHEMMKLPRPPLIGGTIESVVAPSTPASQRAMEQIRERLANIPNLHYKERPGERLRIYGMGRHLGLDVRLVDAMASDDQPHKVVLAADRIVEIYNEHTANRGTQMVFSDLSTPKGDDWTSALPGRKGFNIYDELKKLLVARGIPSHEVRFVHEFDTKEKRKKMQREFNDGRIRILIGSSSKMGVGLNIQTRAVALHRLDVPWRPDWVEQSEARILRQGNVLYRDGKIPGVRVIRYVTEGSYDERAWQIVEVKAKMMAQSLVEDPPSDSIDALDDEMSATAAIMSAKASDNPLEIKLAEWKNKLGKLQILQTGYQREKTQRASQLGVFQKDTQRLTEGLDLVRRTAEEKVDLTGSNFRLTIGKQTFTDRKQAAEALFVEGNKARTQTATIGKMGAWNLTVMVDSGMRKSLVIESPMPYQLESRDDTATPTGLLASLEYMYRENVGNVAVAETKLERHVQTIRELEQSVAGAFPKQADLEKARAEVSALRDQLGITALEKGEKKKKDDEPEERLAVSDPFSAVAAMTISAVKKHIAARRQAEADAYHSDDPALETAWKARYGIPRNRWAGLLEAGETAKRLTRHFPHIPAGRGNLEGLTHDLLLELEFAATAAEQKAIDFLKHVVRAHDLTSQDEDLLSRALAMADEARMAEETGQMPTLGRKGDMQSFHDEHNRVMAAVEKNPKVKAAIETRQKQIRQLSATMVRARLLPKEVLSDERYFHRQVLEYFNAKERQGLKLGLNDAHARRMGFQKARSQTAKDYNTKWRESEYEWVAQAHYLLALRRVQLAVKAAADIAPQLKRMAKDLNSRAFAAKASEQDKEQIKKYGGVIGMATRDLYKMLDDGTISSAGFDEMVLAMADTRQAWRDENRGGKVKDRTPFRFDHPDWMDFLRAQLSKNLEGAKSAAIIFKYQKLRQDKMDAVVGDDLVDWQDEKWRPEGYVEWQPKVGNTFHRGLSIQERTLDAILSGQEELTKDKVQQALLMGGKLETWIVPDWLAMTLDDFGKKKVEDADDLERKLVSAWKWQKLYWPTRVLKYAFNNQIGDLDASLLAPKVFKYALQSAKDLKNYQLKTNPLDDRALEAEMHQAVELRVIGNTFSATEITDIGEAVDLYHLTEMDPMSLMGLLWRYPEFSQRLMQWRENIMRLASYRHFLTEIKAGRNPGAVASNPAKVKALEKYPERQAALLARDLVGDYGGISSGGRWASARIFSFWRFQEINLRRYFWYFRNAVQEGKASGAAKATAVGALRGVVGATAMTAKGIILANVFNTMIQVWNATMFGDEDDELRRRNRQQYLILGRDDDGNIMTLRAEGAFSDFLAWLSLNDLPDDVRGLIAGTKTYAEQAWDMAAAPVQKLVDLAAPLSIPFQLIAGKTFYPDFREPRTIRDRKEFVAQQLELKWLYKKVTGRPLPKDSASPLTLLVTQTDPGEAAYFRTRDLVRSWREEHGEQSGGGGEPTERANALFYYRESIKFGDEKAQDRWLDRYFELGGSKKGLHQSMNTTSPLFGLDEKQRRGFYATLTDEERESVDRGLDWHATLYGSQKKR